MPPLTDVATARILKEQREETEALKKLNAEMAEALKAETRRLIFEGDYDDEYITTEARKRVEAKYGKPLTVGFNKKSPGIVEQGIEKVADTILPEPIAKAVKPQIRAGSASQNLFNAEQEFALEEERRFPEFNPEGIAPEDVPQQRIQYNGLRAAWEQLAKENPRANRKQLQSLLDDELSSLPDTLAGKGRVIHSNMSSGGPNVPIVKSLRPQVTPEDVPDLTPAQRAFYEKVAIETADAQRDTIEKEVRADTSLKGYDVKVVRGEGVQIPRPLNEEEIQREIDARVAKLKDIPWWATGKKEEVLGDLNKYSTGGVFTARKYPLGVVEGAVPWTLRMLFTPLSAGVAAMGSIAEKIPASKPYKMLAAATAGVSPATQDYFVNDTKVTILPAREDVNTNRKFPYDERSVGTDILYAIATGHTAAEEIGSQWRESPSEWVKKHAWMGTAAGLAGDLIVPIDYGLGAVAGATKTGVKTAKATEAIYGAKDLKTAWEIGIKELKQTVPFLKDATPGDVRLLLGKDAGEFIEGFSVYNKAIANGDDFATALTKVTEAMGEDSKVVKAIREAGTLEGVEKIYTKAPLIKRETEDLNRIMRDVESFSTSERITSINPKDIRRWTRAIITEDSSIYKLVKNEKTSIDMVKAILGDSKAKQALIRQIAWERGVYVASEATKDTLGIAKDLVMVTPHSWVEKRIVPEILGKVEKTRIGALAKKLQSYPLTTKTISLDGKGVVSKGWTMKKESAKGLVKYISQRYATTGILSTPEIKAIFNEIGEGFISTKSMRTLINAETDLMVQGTKSGLTEGAVNKLSDYVRKEFLQPVETRSLTSGWFNELRTKIFKPPVTNKELSITAQQELNTLMQSVQNMDKGLRFDIRRLQNDDAFRALYGVEPGQKLTRDESIIRLTLGQVEKGANGVISYPEAGKVYDTIENFYIHHRGAMLQAGEGFQPIIYSKSTNIFTEEARVEIIGKFIKEHPITPENYTATISEFTKKLKETAADSKNLLPRFRDGSIVMVGDKYIHELIPTTYYKMQAQRLSDTAIKNIFQADLDAIGGTFLYSVPNANREGYAEILSILSGEPIKSGEELIKAWDAPIHRWFVHRGKEVVDDTIKGSDSVGSQFPEYALKIMFPKASSKQIAEVLNERGATGYVGYILNAVEDSIETAIRRNGLTIHNLATDLEEFEDILVSVEKKASKVKEKKIATVGKLFEQESANTTTNLILEEIDEAGRGVARELSTVNKELSDTRLELTNTKDEYSKFMTEFKAREKELRDVEKEIAPARKEYAAQLAQIKKDYEDTIALYTSPDILKAAKVSVTKTLKKAAAKEREYKALLEQLYITNAPSAAREAVEDARKAVEELVKVAQGRIKTIEELGNLTPLERELAKAKAIDAAKKTKRLREGFLSESELGKSLDVDYAKAEELKKAIADTDRKLDDFFTQVYELPEKIRDVRARQLEILPAISGFKTGIKKLGAKLKELEKELRGLRREYAITDRELEKGIKTTGKLKERLEKQNKTLRETIVAREETIQGQFDKAREIVIGQTNIKLINDATGSVKELRGFQSYLEKLYTDKGTLSHIGDYASAVFGKFQALRYHLILGWRPRFHGANYVTAPSILLNTLGPDAAMKAVTQLPGVLLSDISLGLKTVGSSTPLAKPLDVAGDVVGKANEQVSKYLLWRFNLDINWTLSGDILREGIFNPGGATATKIAVTSPAGSIWTYEDIYKLAVKGGALRGRHSFQISEVMVDAVLKEAEISIPNASLRSKVIKEFNNLAASPLEMAEIEDNVWRMSVLLDSLRAGESEAIALEKARVSMFDYSKLTPWERQYCTRYLLFYTFTRMNVVHTMNNMLHNPNRVKNALAIGNDVTRMFTGGNADDVYFYQPDWSRSRPVLQFVEGIDKETYYSMGPSMVPNEAVVMVVNSLSHLLSLEIADGLFPLTNMVTPEIKMALGTDTQMKYMKPGVIDARDVAIMQTTGTWEAFTWIIGEEPASITPDAGESTYGGKRWVVSDVAYSKYQNLLMFRNVIGVSTVMRDFAQWLPNGEGRNLETSLPEMVGLVTEVSGLTPARVRTILMNERAKQIQKTVSRTED